jgi:putative aldouronate transport system substrate-binding protein
VDPDSLTQRFDTALQKANEGRVMFGWWPWFSGGFNTPDHANADPPKGYRPVLTSDYKAIRWGDNKVGSPWSWSIGAKTKYPDAALKIVDYLYSTEGLLE